MLEQQTLDCDVLVIGSGAGGLAAAVTAAHSGLYVIVAEKAPVFGGTTAYSGGWLWIPGAPHAIRAGRQEAPGRAEAYIRQVTGDKFNPTLVNAYLEAAPQMVAFFEQHTEVQFDPGSHSADFYGELPAAAEGWRSLVARPYNGAGLGNTLSLLRNPLPETTVAGLAPAAGADMKHFFQASRSPASAWYVAKRLLQHGTDLLRRGQTCRLANGNALAARLLRSALDAGVRLIPSAAATELRQDGEGRIIGALLDTPDACLNIRAARGVVLACGGFPHDKARLQQWVEPLQHGAPHHSAAPETNSGDGLRMAEQAGAAMGENMASPCAWAPVSLIPRKNGSLGRFPHLIERGKPGLIAVLANGERFTNEGAPYYNFIRDLFAAAPTTGPVCAWLLCDHAFIRRYGLGAVKPFPFPMDGWLANGYLQRAQTPEELAQRCGIDPAALRRTIDEYNRHAEHGEDPQFGRGGNLYQRNQGDPDHRPNPCVAPLAQAPYYAVKVVPGSLGTFRGILIDEHARVLRADGSAIPNLYAAGNDANSIFGGYYPSGGITLGPAMTFGYLAANTIAGEHSNAPENPL